MKEDIYDTHSFEKMVEISNNQRICYIEEMSITVKKLMDKNKLSKYEIRCYIRHLPIREINSNWSEKVYEASDKLIRELYNYSKQRKFITDKISYDKFLNVVFSKSWDLFYQKN